MIGLRFAKLVVTAAAGKTRWSELLWRCRCDCGGETVVQGKNLRSGRTRSCGCLVNAPGHGVKHGGKGTRLYRIWSGMITRCENNKSKDYSRYGGAGITVHAEWRASFEAFRAWATTTGYADGLYIDRKDGRSGYEPNNCRWLTPTDSARHTKAVKLSLRAASDIREIVSSGASHGEVASMFGVSRSSVSQICEGKSWLA